MLNESEKTAESDSTPGSADTEREIFRAARRVFAAKGRDGARMREIAEAAGIHRTLLHYYYRSKERLYDEVVEEAFDEFLDSFGDALVSAKTFEEMLEAFIDHYLDYIASHRYLVGLFVNENLGGGRAFGRRLKAALESSEPTPPRTMVERIGRAAEAGEIRPVDPRHTMLSIISLCLFFFVATPTVEMIEPTAEEDFDRFLEDRKAHLLDLLLRGLKVREGGA